MRGKTMIVWGLGAVAYLFAPTLVFAQENGHGNGNGNGNGAYDQNDMNNDEALAPPPAPEPTTESPDYVPPPQPTYVAPATNGDALEIEQGLPRSGFGTGLTVGGGVTNFVESDARGVTNVGGAWDVRLTLGTRLPVGFEASYAGSAHEVNSLGVEDDAALVRNGAEGALRLNIPLTFDRFLLSPFAIAGVGWHRYDLVNTDFNTSGIQEDDNVFVIPLGAGLGGSYQGFLFDARFTYKPAFDDDFLGAGVDLDTWTVSANIGAEF